MIHAAGRRVSPGCPEDDCRHAARAPALSPRSRARVLRAWHQLLELRGAPKKCLELFGVLRLWGEFPRVVVELPDFDLTVQRQEEGATVLQVERLPGNGHSLDNAVDGFS